MDPRVITFDVIPIGLSVNGFKSVIDIDLLGSSSSLQCFTTEELHFRLMWELEKLALIPPLHLLPSNMPAAPALFYRR